MSVSEKSELTLGIMQPYFFPYLGHYQLILSTDEWIVFDVVHYNRRSWMNRNRILHPSQGWQYVNVPVGGSQSQLLSDVTVVDAEAARHRILGQLAHYQGWAPYFRDVCNLVNLAFDRAATSKLRDLNIQSLAVVCDYLDIPFRWSICSQMGIDLSGVRHAGQWALEICSAVGAKRYINPPGGRDIFRPEEWKARDIELRFIQPQAFIYSTGPYTHESHLSIIDILMWNDKASVKSFLSSTMNISE